MITNSIAPSRVIGCDVGKATITVFDSASRQTRVVPNRKPDLVRMAQAFDAGCLVVCEATGGFEAKLLAAMLAAGVPAHRADARKVKAFIRSFGTLGKSDAIDAQALARYGAERHATLARWVQPDPVREELQALVLARVDLVRLRQAQLNRLAAPGAKVVATMLRAIVREADKQLRALEARIAACLRGHPALARDMGVLRAMRGIGEVTGAALLALMPELGAISGRQAASLAGVAPHPHESGQRVGYRKTRGGRPDVKRTLFMAALVASRGSGALAEMYQRLIARGKKPIVAVTAVMRKLIVIANARLRDARADGGLQVS
jgi:transposase